MENQGFWGKVNYNFTIYQSDGFIKKDNVISVSLFLKKELDEVYAHQRGMTLGNLRKDYQNKKTKYKNGLVNLVKKIKDFNLQIFCDESSFLFCQKYINNPLVQVIKYDFPQFKVDGEHFGYFGTLMRFMPLFGLSGRWANVIVLDLDINFKFDLMKHFLSQDAKLMFWSRPNYFLSERMFEIKPKFGIICSMLMQKGQINSKIFIDYLNNFILKKNVKYVSHVRKYLSCEPLERPFNGSLEYGTDEYFLNLLYLKHFPEYRVILYREIIGGVMEYLRLLRSRNFKLKKEMGLFLDKFVEIFGLEEIPKMKLNEKLNFVIEKFYENNFNIRFRNQDHLLEILELHRFLTKNDEMKKINLYDELIRGLMLNAEIPLGFFHLYDQNKVLHQTFKKN